MPYYEDIKIIKRTNCRSCGFFDGTFCRAGLGWKLIKNPIGFCKSHQAIRRSRCGNCKHFYMPTGHRDSGCCRLHADFRNFHDFCYSDPGYELVPGKDLRPIPDTPPKFYTKDIWLL